MKQRALDGPLLPLVRRLNEIRRENPALQRFDNLDVPRDRERQPDRVREARGRQHACSSCVNLDPFEPREGLAIVPGGDRAAAGVRGARPARATSTYPWQIGRNYVRLGPGQSHVLRVERYDAELTAHEHRDHVAAHGRATAERDRGQTIVVAGEPGHWFESDPLWFKRAVFYEIHIRGFFDSDDDGAGDLRGLQEKLDYLQWLGVDCIWLLPMYPSPLRDGGYDIADFYDVHPDYGTVEDFRNLVEAAHERGIRVIADLVMNHTSSDHPWFQESRSSRDSPKRDWYVWSDTDDRWTEARIIFIDTEPSNWTWDPVAGRTTGTASSRTSPTSTTTTPRCRRRCSRCCASGSTSGSTASGSTPCRTSRARRHERREPARDARVPEAGARGGRRALPRPRAARRGEPVAGRRRRLLRRRRRVPHGFHFPVMPRMFMALRREDATPIIEILEQTPAIPENCQWGLFLRNHDELTLEMVTDEERDYMYAEYAKDPRMKLNLGIRRRLAPLLDNGRDEIELLTAILFSLPGSPILYYGDEIGMGDNVYLGDRDGVRTPMQWTGDRNGGFSRADFAQLYLPPLMDPVYGYQAVNVEAQLRTPTRCCAGCTASSSCARSIPSSGSAPTRR